MSRAGLEEGYDIENRQVIDSKIAGVSTNRRLAVFRSKIGYRVRDINCFMRRLKDLAIYRGIPLIIGLATMYYWGDDTKNREEIVFCLATFAAHSVLSTLSVARSVDQLSDKLAARSGVTE